MTFRNFLFASSSTWPRWYLKPQDVITLEKTGHYNGRVPLKLFPPLQRAGKGDIISKFEGLNTILVRLFDKLEYENEELKEFDEEFTDELNKEIDALFSD